MSTLFAPTATGSIIPHLLLPTAQILAFALPPFRYRSHVFVPIILGLIYATWSNLCSDGPDMRGLMIGQWPWYLNTLEKLLFHPIPEQDCWRVGNPTQEAMSMSFFDKLKWSAALYCNPRGIGWNYQVRGIPKQRAPSNKMGFIVQQIKEIAIVFLAIDALDVYNSRHYYKPGYDPLKLTIRGGTWPTKILNAYSGLANQFLSTSYLYIHIATFSVLLGGGQPKDWPPLYGSILDSYTLRRFWNTFWHQITRHMLVAYSADLRDMLHIRRGTWLSSYVELYFAFFFCALFHGLSTYALPYGPNYSFDLRFLMWFKFMVWQAPAIQLEDFVLWCYKRVVQKTEGKVREGEQKRVDMKPKTWHKIIGYIWVWGWWYSIMHSPADAMLRFGVVKKTPIPFSVLNPIVSWVETALARSG